MNKYLKIILIILSLSLSSATTYSLMEVMDRNDIGLILGGKYNGKFLRLSGSYAYLYNSYQDASAGDNQYSNWYTYSSYWDVEKSSNNVYEYVDNDMSSFKNTLIVIVQYNDVDDVLMPLPPDINIQNIYFTESSSSAIANEGTQSNILKGNSSGLINFEIENKGRGSAKHLYAILSTSRDAPELLYSSTYYLGNIKSGEIRTVNWDLRAKISAESRDHNFIIDVFELNGFDATTKYFNLSVQEIANPELVVNSVTISDDMEGTSYGNGNGRIEKGETIEVIVQIQNKGTGVAENVKITLGLEEKVNGFFLPDLDPTILETLKPNETVDITLYFYTNKKITQQDVDLQLNVTEKSGEFPLGKKINFDIE